MTFKSAYNLLEKQLGGNWHSHDIHARHHFTREEDSVLPTNMLENTDYFWARFDAEYAVALSEKLAEHEIPHQLIIGSKDHVPAGQADMRIRPPELEAVKRLNNNGEKPLHDMLVADGLTPRPSHEKGDMAPTRAREFLAKQLGGTWHPAYENARAMKMAHYSASFPLAYGEALVQLLESKGFRPNTTAHTDENRLEVHISPAQLRDIIMPLADTSPAKIHTLKHQLEDQFGLPHHNRSLGE